MKTPERQTSTAKPWRHIAVVAGVWFALALVQWVSHVAPLSWTAFRAWEVVAAPDLPFHPHARYAGQASGDLGNIAGVPQLKHRHRQVFTVDEYGFRNPVGWADRRPQVVVVGDSFAAGSQLSDHETLAALIESELGLVTYNYATMPLRGFFYDERFRDATPRVVVAFHVERELNADLFTIPEAETFRPRAYADQNEYRRTHRRGPRALWRERTHLASRRSLVTWAAERLRQGALWSARLYDFPPQIAHFDPTTGFLFYAEGSWVKRSPAAQRKRANAAVTALVEARAKLARRNIELVTVIAPDKETVYHDLIPDLADRAVYEVLDDFVKQSRRRGARVAEVHWALADRRATHSDDLLYFPDDTHLTALGTRIVFNELRSVLAELTQ
ncbi:MAG: hypothetical protein P9L99_02235 [Candidatus Lernaella stagnicola]|nr:hypothetical protein [Candidatus Lernaella stagnicola]